MRGRVCVCMLWPERRHERNMWNHLLWIPNTCSDHEPKQGDGFLFCSRLFWKARLLRHLSTTPSSTYNQPLRRPTLHFNTRMESLERASESPAVSSFPFQLVGGFNSQLLFYTSSICELPAPHTAQLPVFHSNIKWISNHNESVYIYDPSLIMLKHGRAYLCDKYYRQGHVFFYFQPTVLKDQCYIQGHGHEEL